MEQIQRTIPKQRQRTYEHNTPFPVPPIDVNKDLGTLALEHIDAELADES